MNALIVENSRLYRQLIDNILAQQNFENDICSSIQSANDFLQNNQYDIILINQVLGDGSGLEIATACSSGPHSKTPILLLSSNDNLTIDDFPQIITEVIHKNDIQQLNDQIVHYIELHLDPTFYEGKIYLIEASQEIAGIIISQFEHTGYKLVHFTKAEAAWQEFKNEVSYGSDKEAIDLVITDNKLDGEMTGHELVKKIRSIEDARGFIPLMAITPHSDNKHRMELYKSGVNDYLQKPILIEELEIRANSLITNKRLLDKVHDQRRELFALATTDKLTGCHNRHSLMEFSDKFISQAKRHKYPVSVYVIDLDHFKQVNDVHGHAAGDVVLEAIGKLLNQSFREGDLVARFGGEEFVVLLNHCDAEYAAEKAEMLRTDIEKLKPHDLVITSSIGITTLTDDPDEDFESLFSRADLGVYEAKDTGRNKVCAQ